MRFAKQKARQWVCLVGPAALLLISGCANDRGPHPELPRMGVYSGFTSRNLCGLGVSPEFRFVSAPPDATTYRIKMTNVSALAGSSYEFTVPVSAADTRNKQMVIPEATIPDFPAPCVPDDIILRQYFNYRIEVLALASDGRPLAYGWNFAIAYPLNLELYYERLADQARQRDRAAAARSPVPTEPAVAKPPTPPQDSGPGAAAAAAPVTSPMPQLQNSPSSLLPQAQIGPQIGPQIGLPTIRPYRAYPPEVTSYFFIY
jgi:hypothetical protein